MIASTSLQSSERAAGAAFGTVFGVGLGGGSASSGSIIGMLPSLSALTDVMNALLLGVEIVARGLRSNVGTEILPAAAPLSSVTARALERPACRRTLYASTLIVSPLNSSVSKAACFWAALSTISAHCARAHCAALTASGDGPEPSGEPGRGLFFEPLPLAMPQSEQHSFMHPTRCCGSGNNSLTTFRPEQAGGGCATNPRLFFGGLQPALTGATSRARWRCPPGAVRSTPPRTVPRSSSATHAATASSWSALRYGQHCAERLVNVIAATRAALTASGEPLIRCGQPATLKVLAIEHLGRIAATGVCTQGRCVGRVLLLQGESTHTALAGVSAIITTCILCEPPRRPGCGGVSQVIRSHQVKSSRCKSAQLRSAQLSSAQKA